MAERRDCIREALGKISLHFNSGIKLKQSEAVDTLLEGSDVIAVLPSGNGKMQ